MSSYADVLLVVQELCRLNFRCPKLDGCVASGQFASVNGQKYC